ncbi:MAG TPA: hypothetical protein VIU46_11740 [Gallionellaceae bacterium]
MTLKQLAVFILAVSASTAHAELVARAQTGPWQLSIEAEDATSDDCSVNLVADNHSYEHKISLKRKGGGCSFFGPVMIFGTNSPDYKLTHVFVEGARGGDGDHTGPIVEVFAVNEHGIKKLGEQELFDASYQRKDGEVVSISGKVLFSLCDACDGPDAAGARDNIFVPAVITFGCKGICVKPAVSQEERARIVSRFEAAVTAASKEYGRHVDKAFVKRLRTRLMEFLSRAS